MDEVYAYNHESLPSRGIRSGDSSVIATNRRITVSIDSDGYTVRDVELVTRYGSAALGLAGSDI